ncbi:STAS domain-containing protein [Patescibacteria group bacterium]|nr:STAS domain-containing protein [Patescibacteria group bacterium]
MSPIQPNIEFKVYEPDTQRNFQKVSIIGNIDRDTMEKARTQMEVILNNLPTGSVMLDMENLEFINSEGIGYLSDIFSRLYADNKHLMILKASPRIMDIFQLVGLNQIIPCCDTEEECLAKLSQAS